MEYAFVEKSKVSVWLISLAGDFVTEFFKLCRRKESTDEILGRSAFEEEGKGKIHSFSWNYQRLRQLDLWKHLSSI